MPKQYNGEYVVTLDQIIYGSYVRLHRLDQIVIDTFADTSIHYATSANIFIDLYSVLHQIFSRSHRTVIENPLDMTPLLINMCAHYRKFFRSKGVATTFYLVFSPNIHEINRKLVSGYNKSFVEKYHVKIFNNIATNNFTLLDTLCPYLPDIHFVRSEKGYEVAVIMAHLIEEYGKNTPNIIISRDLYPLQLCTKYPYTSYILPLKRIDPKTKENTDQSIMVPLTEKPTHNIAFWNLVASRRHLKPDVFYDINTRNFMLYEAMHQFPERDMGLCGIGNSRMCKKCIVNLGGIVSPIDISTLKYNEMMQELPIALIEARYNALNVDYMLPYFKMDEECQNIKIQNLDDNGVVNNINAKYFVNNPINIGDL